MADLTIWKFGLEVVDTLTLRVPKGAQFLAVQAQGGRPQAWFLVDPEADAEDRVFCTFGTGHTVPSGPGKLEHRGTYQLSEGAFVAHVFERVDAS